MTIVKRKATEQDIPPIVPLASKAFHPATDRITRQIFPRQISPLHQSLTATPLSHVCKENSKPARPQNRFDGSH